MHGTDSDCQGSHTMQITSAAMKPSLLAWVFFISTPGGGPFPGENVY
jgi:hypothetical protein